MREIAAARVRVESGEWQDLDTDIFIPNTASSPGLIAFDAGRVIHPAQVIAERSIAWQRALRAERLAAAGSPRTDEALSEWLSLRDQARACRGGR